MKYSIIFVTILTISLSANGLEEAFKNATYEGYARAGYQKQTNTEISIGGKLHIETASINSVSFGASFYTTQGLGSKYNDGVAFFSSHRDSYSILGEAYLKANIKNTLIKIGLQEFNSPYADTDDIGMIPNTFEAITVANYDISNTTIKLGHLQKMSGVDADIPERFNSLNDSNGVQMLGITHKGIEDVILQGWYYYISNTAKITYLEAEYERNLGEFGVEIGVGGQYTIQNYNNGNEANVYGINLSLGLEERGLTFYGAYNKADTTHGRVVENFFGGGPFFINCEHLTMADVGKNGKAYRYGVEVDGDSYGVKNLGFAISYFAAEGETGEDLNEIDIMANYALNDRLSFDLIYSDTIDNVDNSQSFTNTRFFINYEF